MSEPLSTKWQLNLVVTTASHFANTTNHGTTFCKHTTNESLRNCINPTVYYMMLLNSSSPTGCWDGWFEWQATEFPEQSTICVAYCIRMKPFFRKSFHSLHQNHGASKFWSRNLGRNRTKRRSSRFLSARDGRNGSPRNPNTETKPTQFSIVSYQTTIIVQTTD